MNKSLLKLDLPASDYHRHPALNQSTLKKMGEAKSMAHFKCMIDAEEPDKPEFAFGRAFHTAVLEPDKFEDSVLVFTETKSRGVKFDKFLKENPGRDILLAHEYDLLMAMRDRFFTHPISKTATLGAKVEASVFWEDPATQLECKARFDALRPDIIWDVKTAKDASAAGFGDAAKSYGYHRQAAWYMDAANAVGEYPETVGFIVCEKEQPLAMQVFVLDPQSIEIGRQLNRADITKYAQCKRTGNWPGYPETIQTLSIGG